MISDTQEKRVRELALHTAGKVFSLMILFESEVQERAKFSTFDEMGYLFCGTDYFSK